MVDHRFLQQILRPDEGVGIGALASEEERTEFLKVVLREEFSSGVLLLDRAERGWSSEHRDASVLGDHAPERAEMPRTPSNEAPAKPAVARSMSRRFAGMSVIESSCRALDVKTASSLFNR
jgi:hypothetical protein